MSDTHFQETDLEKSVHHIRGSVFVLIFRVFIVAFLIETLYAFLLAALVYSKIGAAYTQSILESLWLLQTVKFVIEIFLILNIVTRWATTTYYLRDDLLVRVTGIVEVKEDLYDLKNARTLVVEQTWLGRLLNYGTLRVTIASSGFREEVVLAAVSTPRLYEHWINQYLSPG